MILDNLVNLGKMKIYRILGSKGNTTVPWQIRDAMDLRASDVISFEYGSFGEDVIVLRRELFADGGLDDCGYPDAPDGGEFADELEDEPDEDLEVKALLDFISGFSEKAQRSALMQVLLLLPGENGKGKS